MSGTDQMPPTGTNTGTGPPATHNLPRSVRRRIMQSIQDVLDNRNIIPDLAHALDHDNDNDEDDDDDEMEDAESHIDSSMMDSTPLSNPKQNPSFIQRVNQYFQRHDVVGINIISDLEQIGSELYASERFDCIDDYITYAINVGSCAL